MRITCASDRSGLNCQGRSIHAGSTPFPFEQQEERTMQEQDTHTGGGRCSPASDSSSYRRVLGQPALTPSPGFRLQSGVAGTPEPDILAPGEMQYQLHHPDDDQHEDQHEAHPEVDEVAGLALTEVPLPCPVALHTEGAEKYGAEHLSKAQSVAG